MHGCVCATAVATAGLDTSLRGCLVASVERFVMDPLLLAGAGSARTSINLRSTDSDLSAPSAVAVLWLGLGTTPLTWSERRL